MKSLGRPIFEQSQNVTWKPISSVRPPCPPNHNDICHRNGLPRRNLSSRRLESECDFALSCMLGSAYFSIAKYESNEMTQVRMIETRIHCRRTVSGCAQTSHKHFLSTSTVSSSEPASASRMVDCAGCYKQTCCTVSKQPASNCGPTFANHENRTHVSPFATLWMRNH